MVDDPPKVPTTDGYATTDPGHAGAETVPENTLDATTQKPGATDARAIVSWPPAGYDIGEVIGRGGMGEVLAAHDRRIGRDVAVKRMRDPLPDAHATQRFLREARIQGRLDHPAIVPVHELGIDEAGRPFFTMKRLAGRTLADHLANKESIQPLLRAFVDVCLAIELAHEHGVVHRDLKPSNIMLGDYGEVYVLDWGIARVIAEEERLDSGGDIDTLDERTGTGTMLGTPGYMSPEQVRGEPVDSASDLYALGAILFEILAGEPLHARGTPGIATTLASAQQSPSKRRPDRMIAPELDRACFGALHEIAMQRPRARTLANQVQRYLDGDRDLESRRVLAAELMTEARAALATDRAAALRLAGRALALDQKSTDAATLVTTLLLEPPATLPDDCQRMLDKEHARAATVRTRLAALVTISVFAFWLVVPFLSVRSSSWLFAFYGIHAAIAGMLYYAARRMRPGYLWVTMVATVAAAIIWSRIAGPFLLNPVMLCGALMGYTANPRVTSRPWTVVAWAVVAVMLPLVLEWTGLLAQSTTIAGNRIEIESFIYDIRGNLELGVLTVANLAFVILVALYALSINRFALRMQRSLLVQNWQLNQMVSRAPG